MERRFDSKKKVVVSTPWHQFRGANRDGVVAWLPSRLPDLSSSVVWSVDLPSAGVGGIVADERYVVVGSRDLEDRRDVYQCFDFVSGTPLWQDLYEAQGSLDYGNSPRATPLIHNGLIYTLGALGDLRCLDLETGVCLWNKHLIRDFGGKLPDWGFSGSPLIVNEQLILQPGGKDCSLAALDPLSGEIIWKVPGKPAVYASLVLRKMENKSIVIGLEADGPAAWDADSGQVLWRHRLPVRGDFGVPTPVFSKYGWLFTSENNGTRLYSPTGRLSHQIGPNPSPDAHTPVIVGDSAFVMDDRLYCLDLANELQERWHIQDRKFRGYASIIASDTHLLVFTESGELFLVDHQAATDVEGSTPLRIVDRWPVAEEKVRCLSHPALVGDQLLVRFGLKLARISLD